MHDRALSRRLFVTCWVVFVLFFATNSVREIYPALALADHGTFDVSEYAGLHPDIFEVPGRGWFINNNPGASVLGALPYLLVRPLVTTVVSRVESARRADPRPPPEYNSGYEMSREFYREARRRGLDVKLGLGAAVMQAGLMAPLSALSVVVMFWVLRSLGVDARRSAVLALLYALATPVLYRTAQLNHNLIVAHCGWFAFALLFSTVAGGGRPAGWKFLAAGTLAGWAVVTDYSGVVIAAGTLGYALVLGKAGTARWWVHLGWLATGLCLSLAFLVTYQWVSFGHPLWPAQRYMPESTYSGAGLRGFGWPDPGLLGLVLVSPRYGLLTSAPILCFAVWPGTCRKRGAGLLSRREWTYVVAITAAVLLFTASNQYARMQFNSGIRHAVPAVPFLFLLASASLLRLPRGLAAALAVPATVWSVCLAMYRDVEQGRGIVDAVAPVFSHGPTFPWVSTLERLGYVETGVVGWPLLAMLTMVLCAVWWRPLKEGWR